MAKEIFITRRVIENKEYKVFKVEGTTLELLGTEVIKGKVSEKEIAEKYGVSKVFIDCVKENKVIYGVPVDKFMEMAVVLEDKKN